MIAVLQVPSSLLAEIYWATINQTDGSTSETKTRESFGQQPQKVAYLNWVP